jgi:hypothetical protein
MPYGGTPWGYIHKKRELAEAESRIADLKSNADDLLKTLKKEIDEQHQKGNIKDEAYQSITKILGEFKAQ